MNWVLIRPEELDERNRAVLTGRRFLHLRDVLHVEPGRQIRVGVIGRNRYLAAVIEMRPDACVVGLETPRPGLPEPSIDLVLALPRPKSLQRLLPQLAAVGMGRLHLVHAKKVARDYWGSQLIRTSGFSALLEEGLEQAGDVRVPTVTLWRQLTPCIQDELAGMYAPGCKWVAHPSVAGENLVRMAAAAPEGRMLLAVGPEGGWTESELALFDANGFSRFGIGPRVLRSDTACIALLSILAWERGSGLESGRLQNPAGGGGSQ